MLCKACGYALWSLPSGRCPECGRDFKPSEFQFRPGKVNFLCPHCKQAYVASDPDGQPPQEQFACTKCDETIHVDEMLVIPAAGVSDQDALAVRTPWLDRKRLGWWKGFWRTVGISLVRPGDLVSGLPEQGGVLSALSFALNVAAFVALVSFLSTFVLLGLLLPALAGGGAGGGAGLSMGLFWMSMMSGFGCLSVGVLLWPIIAVGLWALLAHGVLLITGNRAGTLATTYRAMLYGQGPLVLQAIPLCGSYVAWIWLTVSSILTVKRAQEVHGFRATVAVSLPPFLLVGGYIALILSFVVAGMNNAMGGGGVVTSAGPSLVGPAIVKHASPTDGAGPDHILKLVADGSLTMQELVDPLGGGVDWDLIEVDEWTAGELQALPPDKLRTLAERLAAERDPDKTWYRFGDLVLTYGGMDVRRGAFAGERYVLAYSMENGTGSSYREDSGVMFYSNGSFDYVYGLSWHVEMENERRKQAGLPPIPTIEEAYPEVP